MPEPDFESALSSVASRIEVTFSRGILSLSRRAAKTYGIVSAASSVSGTFGSAIYQSSVPTGTLAPSFAYTANAAQLALAMVWRKTIAQYFVAAATWFILAQQRGGNNAKAALQSIALQSIVSELTDAQRAAAQNPAPSGAASFADIK